MTDFAKAYLFGFRLGMKLRQIFVDPKSRQMHGPWPIPPKEFMAWWTRRNWKTHIQPGVIGSKDKFWLFSSPLMADTTESPEEIVTQCFTAAVPLVQHCIQEHGVMPAKINVVRNVWTGNRCVQVPIEFEVRETEDDSSFGLWTTAEQQAKLRSMPRAIKAFLN